MFGSSQPHIRTITSLLTGLNYGKKKTSFFLSFLVPQPFFTHLNRSKDARSGRKRMIDSIYELFTLSRFLGPGIFLASEFLYSSLICGSSQPYIRLITSLPTNSKYGEKKNIFLLFFLYSTTFSSLISIAPTAAAAIKQWSTQIYELFTLSRRFLGIFLTRPVSLFLLKSLHLFFIFIFIFFSFILFFRRTQIQELVSLLFSYMRFVSTPYKD